MASSSKIYRSDSDYILAGVCGGLAEHFQIDPTLLRLVFVLLTIGGGSGVLIYLILWLVIPRENGKTKESVREENIKEFTSDIEEKVKVVGQEIHDTFKRDNVKQEKGSIIGVAVLLIGLIALWDKIFPNTIRWDMFWPVILIVIGTILILRKK
jgi:phage shock protein C